MKIINSGHNLSEELPGLLVLQAFLIVYEVVEFSPARVLHDQHDLLLILVNWNQTAMSVLVDTSISEFLQTNNKTGIFGCFTKPGLPGFAMRFCFIRLLQTQSRLCPQVFVTRTMLSLVEAKNMFLRALSVVLQQMVPWHYSKNRGAICGASREVFWHEERFRWHKAATKWCDHKRPRFVISLRQVHLQVSSDTIPLCPQRDVRDMSMEGQKEWRLKLLKYFRIPSGWMGSFGGEWMSRTHQSQNQTDTGLRGLWHLSTGLTSWKGEKTFNSGLGEKKQTREWNNENTTERTGKRQLSLTWWTPALQGTHNFVTKRSLKFHGEMKSPVPWISNVWKGDETAWRMGGGGNWRKEIGLGRFGDPKVSQVERPNRTFTKERLPQSFYCF